MTMAALQVVDLHVWYAHGLVLNGINLHAMPGEAVALLGRNGSGRSAALHAIGGQTDTLQGSVRVIGTETIHDASPDIAYPGLGVQAAEGSIFSHLTCEENLLLPTSDGDSLGGGMSLGRIYQLCPDLGELRDVLATQLSRAEQRMLAIARILRTGANVILLSDIADGLAPIMAQAFAGLIVELKKLDYTIILAEADTTFCGAVADRFYVFEQGRIIDTFDAGDLAGRQNRCQDGAVSVRAAPRPR